jgi:DNA invertase Pin-like site-specific DNA recombinase
MTKAIAYLRTSSLANVGADKDSDKRQREAIARYASHHGLEIVDEFYDAGVSGKDPIETRPGFNALLDRIEGNGVRTVVVEDASRFARDLMTQELGLMLLIQRGVKVFSANGDELTETDDPMKKAMRQIGGVFAELEKARLVAKLKHGRDRKRAETGQKVGGRRNYAETHPAMVTLAKRLDSEGDSLRTIAQKLADAGFVSESGNVHTPMNVKRMLER